MIILNDQSQEKTSIKQSNITKRISTNIGTNKQNFQGEVISGNVMSLIKQTLENIRYGRQSRWHCSRFGSKLKPSYCLSTLSKTTN